MIDRRPSSSVLTLPETGASSICAPRSRTSPARLREAAGLTVLMSTSTFPGPRPVSTPWGPSTTCSSALVFVTITNTTRLSSAAWRGVS